MVARSVAAILGNHVTLSVECIDRMYLNVYVPKLQREKDEDVGGIPGYEHFLAVIGNPKDPEHADTKR